jgi:site-specific recombinase XerD
MTQWRRQRETRAFFSWLLHYDYTSANPFAKVKNIKVPRRLFGPSLLGTALPDRGR